MGLATVRRHSAQYLRSLLNVTGCLTVRCAHCHVLCSPYDPLEGVSLCRVFLSCLCCEGEFESEPGLLAGTGALRLSNPSAS